MSSAGTGFTLGMKALTEVRRACCGVGDKAGISTTGTVGGPRRKREQDLRQRGPLSEARGTEAMPACPKAGKACHRGT